MQVDIANAPLTTIDPKRGVVTAGNLTLAFHLAPDEADAADRAQASRQLQGQAKKGAHLFTMGIYGEIRASKLALEPDVPDRPDSYRLGVTMELVMDSLKIQVHLLAPANYISADPQVMEQFAGCTVRGRTGVS